MGLQAKYITGPINLGEMIPHNPVGIHKDDFELMQQVIRINQDLHASLNLNQILVDFSDNIRAFIPFTGFLYENKADSFRLIIGKNNSHALSYHLKLEENSLGMLRISREKPFSPQEIKLAEYLLSLLVFPLKNSLQYMAVLNNSLHDTLTGVSNRAAFNEAFEREVSLAKRHQLDLSLLIIDIDNFKAINDNYGHNAGDIVLNKVCRVIESSLRKTDKIYRYGGDELVVILNKATAEGAMMLANRALTNTGKRKFKANKRFVNVTISIGISTYKEAETSSSFFERADKAVYKAKSAGKNQIISDD